MSKMKKWSIIAAVVSTLAAGGAGVAYTQGYFGGSAIEAAAAEEEMPDGKAADADSKTPATDLAEGAPSDTLAEEGSVDTAASATSPTSSDPFAAGGVTSTAGAYGDTGSAMYEPPSSRAGSADSGDIPSAAAAFAGIEPVDLKPPAELADPAAMSDAATAELTPPVAPQAITGDPTLLPVPDATQRAAYSQDTYSQDTYGQDSYAQTAPLANQYDNNQYGNTQYGDTHDANGAAPAATALATGLGGADGSPAADTTQDPPNENTLGSDSDNPLRHRYGEAPVNTATAAAAPTAAAPATPIDAASLADAYQADPYAAAAPPVAPLAPVTDTTGRGAYAQPAPASPMDTTNAPAVGIASEGLIGVGVAAAAVGASAGQPGPAQLEGMQQASVSIEKRAPVETQVGRKAIWEIFVRNTGQVTAQGVEVHDDIPRGATLASTYPQAQASDGRIVWSLGSLEPGEERRLEMEIVPQVEGDMGSVARVVVGAEATARATVTKPQLQIDAAAPEEVLIGSLARLVIKISNVGTGVAHAVRLEEQVPDLFKHPGGERLIFEVGDLGPKQVRELDLMLTATKAGVTDNLLTVRATGNFTAEKTSRVEVVAPKLEVHFTGPKKRYLQREGTFTLTLNNPGTATAHNVQLAAHIPDGLEFVDANNSGYYDPTTRTVHWLLEELPPQQPAEVKLSARAVKEGAHPLVVECTTPLGLRAELSQPIVIEGLAAVSFEVRDVQDPVEVGGRTAYEIRVVNQGSKAATNVVIAAVIPPTMRALDASGPTRHTVAGGRLVFAPLPRLAARADTTYTIEVEAIRAGDSRLRVELTSDDTTTPVTRDEPTVVFSDE